MSNVLYDKGRQAILEGSIAWLTDTIKASLVRSSTYTPAPTTDQFLSTVTSGGAVVATATLASKTSTNGVAGCADITWPAVAAGAAVQYVVIYKDTGSAATSPLIAIIDTATGLPVTPSGGDLKFTVDTGSNKLFKL